MYDVTSVSSLALITSLFPQVPLHIDMEPKRGQPKRGQPKRGQPKRGESKRTTLDSGVNKKEIPLQKGVLFFFVGEGMFICNL